MSGCLRSSRGRPCRRFPIRNRFEFSFYRPAHNSAFATEQNVTEQRGLNDEKLVTVAQRGSEVAASILVSVLQDEGIRAIATGGFTAGFRAEAPGMVRVQTLESDAERAKQIIAELREEIDPEDAST